MCIIDVSRVLIIYTGGTIGMKHTPEHGYVPVSSRKIWDCFLHFLIHCISSPTTLQNHSQK